MHTHAPIEHTYTNTHMNIHMHTHAPIKHTCTYTHAHTRTHTRARTHTRTHANTHAPIEHTHTLLKCSTPRLTQRQGTALASPPPARRGFETCTCVYVRV